MRPDFDLKRLWYVKDVLRFLLNVNYFSKYLDALNKTIRNNEEVIEILSYFIDRYFVFALSKYNISRLFIYVLQLAYLQFFVYKKLRRLQDIALFKRYWIYIRRSFNYKFWYIALRCDAHFTHEHPVCALPDLNHGSGEGKGSDKHNLPHSTRSGSRDTKKN